MNTEQEIVIEECEPYEYTEEEREMVLRRLRELTQNVNRSDNIPTESNGK